MKKELEKKINHMKVVFVNPPVIKYKNFSPENDIRVSDSKLLKLLSKLKKRKIIRKPINYLFMFSGLRFGVRAGSRWPWTCPRPHGGPPYPFIMGYATSYLRSKGIDVTLIDAIAEEQYSYSDFLKEVKEEKPDIVVLECSTSTILIDLWMAKEISKFSEVALAGSHLTLKCSEVKKENPYVSYFLKGEYILSSLKMAKTKKHGIYESEVVTNIDSIPFPFRDYKSATKYYDPTMPTEKPQLQIYGSKGCPFKCSFCLWPQTMYQGKVSLRSPKKIAQEIKECIKKYGYKSIFFDDDTFNIGNERISELCDELKKIGLPWTMMGRFDCSPSWLYDKMVDSGCMGMRFGIETFNIKVLKKINKGLERTDFLRTLEYISSKYPKLMIHLTMMKDLPRQTKEIHEKDMQILKKLGYMEHKGFPYYTDKYRNFQLSHCVPFPGTKMYEDLIKEKGEDKLKDYRLYDGGQDTVMTKINSSIEVNKKEAIEIQERSWDEAVKRRTKALYSKQYKDLKFKISKPVLEIGGGPGTFLKFLNIDKATIINLAGKRNLVNKNYYFIKKDITKKLNIKRKYKTIFIMETLEHIHNPLYLMAQVYDILDKDGRCYIAIPYTSLDFKRKRGLGSHICRWKLTELKDQMEKIGFNVGVIQKRRRFKDTAFYLPHCWIVLELNKSID